MSSALSAMPTTESQSLRAESDWPRRRVLALVVGVLAGVALAIAWSAAFVDQEIGMRVSDSVLGHDARQTAISSSLAGIAFAFVSGFAGTLTACNVAVFGALPSVTAPESGRAARIRATLTALGWLALGMVPTAAVYGFVAVLIGRDLPQLSSATIGDGLPVRLVQSVVVFGLVGVAFGYLGLAALRLVPDPLANRPRARLVVLGVLVGCFLIGRPYPLFFKLLTYAVDSHNPFYGALTLVLQSLGNLIVMALIALLVTAILSAAASRWLAQPARAAYLAGAALLLVGTFLLVYWDVRLPAAFGYGYFPTMPWNS